MPQTCPFNWASIVTAMKNFGSQLLSGLHLSATTLYFGLLWV